MAVNREEMITCLNDLIESCRDSEQGYRTAAEHAKNADLREFLGKCAYQRAQFTSELQAKVRLLDGEPTEKGSVSGMFHRGWMNLKSAIDRGDESILSECEWGDDATLRNYERVLKQNLPPKVLPALKHHYTQIKGTRNRIRDMHRNAA